MTETEKDYQNPKPLVSIIVLAYNQLNYTKLCIESLYRYTSHMDFELITINNGSSDGTREYFDSLGNQKKINFEENIGVDRAINHGYRLAEGKYTVNVSNDLVLTPNWLDNLVTIAQSDARIGMVVPCSSFSSNYQQVNLLYRDLDEMQLMAGAFNISSPAKWEERLRLITYTSLMPTWLQKELGGFDEDFNPGGFDDDALCFRIRRSGYKLILAMDTFVHHFGSVTFRQEYSKDNILVKNRRLFYDKFGVDSWGVCFIDYDVLNLVILKDENVCKTVDILGIGSSCGATLLQMKNLLKRTGIFDTNIYYISERLNRITDLRTVCTDCICMGDSPACEFYKDKSFDYIVVESNTSFESGGYAGFGELFRRLKPGGQLIFTAEDNDIYEKIYGAVPQDCINGINSIRNRYYSFRKSE